MKKQSEVLSFDWLDDTIFNKWTEDFVHSKQLEIKEDEVNQDERQITDASVQAEEAKEEQSTIVTRTEVQTDDMAAGESDVTVVLSMHDDVDREPRVKVSLQTSKLGPSQVIPLVKPSKECQQPQSQS